MSFDLPIDTPKSVGLMKTVIQVEPRVVVSSAAWYPFGAVRGACYETWIFSSDPLIKTQQIHCHSLKSMFWKHYSITHHLRRHLDCKGDKELAREQYRKDNDKERRQWFLALKTKERLNA